MSEIVIRLSLPEGVSAGVDYVESTPQEPPHMAEMPPITSAPPPAVAQPIAPPPAAPQCPTHGAMTYHAAKTKPDGKQVSARYSCDEKINGGYCPTRPVWL